MLSPIIKGILIGSSFGVIAGVFGITSNIPRGLFLGAITGILAGATMTFLIKRKQKTK